MTPHQFAQANVDGLNRSVMKSLTRNMKNTKHAKLLDRLDPHQWYGRNELRHFLGATQSSTFEYILQDLLAAGLLTEGCQGVNTVYRLNQ